MQFFFSLSKNHDTSRLALTLLVIVIILLGSLPRIGKAQEVVEEVLFITGELLDSQGQPVVGAEVLAVEEGTETPLAQVESQENGAFTLPLTEAPEQPFAVVIERPHFETESFTKNWQESPPPSGVG